MRKGGVRFFFFWRSISRNDRMIRIFENIFQREREIGSRWLSMAVLRMECEGSITIDRILRKFNSDSIGI